jgi:hypothetical protein
MTERRPRPVRSVPTWLRDPNAFAELVAVIAEHNWHYQAPSAVVAPSGSEIRLARIAGEIRAIEEQLNDDQWNALDEAGFLWNEPNVPLAPLPRPAQRQERSIRDQIRAGDARFESVLTLDRSHPTRQPSFVREWMETGLTVCATAKISVIGALGDRELTVTHDGSEFALGVWAHQFARAERWGHGTRLAPFLDARLRRLVNERVLMLARNLGHLDEYTSRRGTADIPADFRVTRADGSMLNLGAWVGDQRLRFGKGVMQPERRGALEAFGVRLEARDKQYWWTLAMDALDQYLAREYADGDLSTPRTVLSSAVETLPDGRTFRLGPWFVAQKQRHRNGTLPKSELRALNRRGLDVTQRRTPDRRFAEGLAALDAYIATTGGDPNAPQGAIVELADGTKYPIGEWICSKRMVRRSGKLPAHQETELAARHVEWEPLQSRFETGLEIFTDFARGKDPLSIPSRIVVPDGRGGTFDLGVWIGKTRRGLRAGRYGPDVVARLHAAGFVENAEQAIHDRKVRAYKQYVAREQTPHVHVDHIETVDGVEVRLGAWAGRVRFRNNQGRLNPQVKRELDALGFVWDVFGAEFDRAVKFLRHYAEREATPGQPLRVPPAHVEHIGREAFALGRWVNGRRGSFVKRGMLPSEAETLFELGCEWANPANNPAVLDPAKRPKIQRPSRSTDAEPTR